MIHKLKCQYVINQVKRAKLPQFGEGDTKRFRIVFSGKVQNVGFRLEAYCLAKRLGLTGWVKNLENGNVEGEFQGTEEKTDFLIKFMSSLKRIRVDKADKKEIPVIDGDKEFIQIRDDDLFSK